MRLTSAGGDNQDGLYWRVEQFLKFFESRIGGLLGANGAIYAIRRRFWKPLRPDTICDDFCVAIAALEDADGLVLVAEHRAKPEVEQEPSRPSSAEQGLAHISYMIYK